MRHSAPKWIYTCTQKTRWFWNGSFLFNPQYLCQILIKSSNHFKSARPKDSETALGLRFDKDLAEILGVKEKASISKLSPFFQMRVSLRLYNRYGQDTIIATPDLFTHKLITRLWVSGVVCPHEDIKLIHIQSLQNC